MEGLFCKESVADRVGLVDDTVSTGSVKGSVGRDASSNG
jgi:hypothetical protein